MELRHIRYFLAVAETLSFTRAAEQLHTSQPSLSQQIRALEREIGRQLFVRTSRSVQLTPAGEAFARSARRALAELRDGVADARMTSGGPDRQLRIGFLVAAEICLFSTLLPKVRAAEPDLDLSLTSMSSRQQLLDLQNDRIDIGFMRPPVNDPRLKTELIMVEQVNVVLCADHPLAALDRIPAEALLPEPIIGLSEQVPGLFQSLADWTARRRLPLNFVQHADNVVEYMSMVRLGIGIGLLPTFANHIVLSGLVIRPLDRDPPTIGMVMAYRAEHSEKTAKFLRISRHAIAELGLLS